MALPRENDTYEQYTEQLVYFSARLSANPTTAALATQVDELLEQLDRASVALREARREEIRARARRDHEDDHGDGQIKKFRRRLRLVPSNHFVITRIFAKGVTHVVAPRGRAQVERLERLCRDIDEVLSSPQLNADPDGDELRAILTDGKAITTAAVQSLRPSVEQWEQSSLAVSRARDTFNFYRADGVGRAGMVLGELRALLGGSAKEAYGYTQSGRSNKGTPEDIAEPPDAEPPDAEPPDAGE